MVVCSDINKSGTGFLISADGHIATNNHVVSQVLPQQNGTIINSYSADIVVVIDGVSYPASLASDPAEDRPFVFDYAILKVDGLASSSHLELGDPTMARLGDEVVCLGFPLDFNTIVATNGIVSAVLTRPSHRNTLFSMKTIVSNVLIQFGNSGGPMIHRASGKVIGMNTLGHEISDVLYQRLRLWQKLPSLATIPALPDLIEYTLKYTYIGFNHAVSVEHVRADTNWPAPL